MELAIVIPTMDRAELLLGQLYFYDNFKLPLKVYVGDSSGEEQKTKILEGLKQLNEIKVIYNYYPKTTMQAEVILNLLKLVEEEFVTISGDDDYHVIPHSFESLKFLKQNPDFACCTGAVALISTNFQNSIRKIENVSNYSPKSSILSSDPLERMKELSINYYLPLFCICRSKDILESFTIDCSIKSNIFWAETVPAFKMIALGKMKVIPGLAFIRGTHNMRPIYKNGIKDTFMNKIWSESLFNSLDHIERFLITRFNLPTVMTKEQIKDIFADYYLRRILKMQASQSRSLKWYQKLPTPIKLVIKKYLHLIKPSELNEGVLCKSSVHFPVFNSLSKSLSDANKVG